MRFRGLFVFCLLFSATLPLGVALASDSKPAFEGEDDICLVQRVSMQKGELQVTGNEGSSPYKKCDHARNLGGCEPETIRAGMCNPCGSVSFMTPSGAPCATVSKCARDYKKRLAACLQKMGIESTDEIDLSDPAAARAAVENLDPTSSADREVLAGILQGMGVSEITGAHVNENPDAAKDLALKILDGDEEGAKAAARELGLNDDLRDVKYLRPADDGEEDRPDAPDVWKYTGGVTLEAAPVGRAASELERAAEVIKQKESGGKYGITTCTNVCVYGAYQVHQANVWKWTCEIGRCATPQQFLRDPELQDAVFRHKFGQYVARSGSYTIAAGMWHGGPGFNPNRSDALGTRTGAYMADFARRFGDPNFVPSTPNYALRDGGSPFSGANPFVSSGAGGYGASASAQPSYAQQAPAQQYPQQQPPRPPVPVSSQILPQGGLQSSGDVSLPPAPVQPIAALIVQPKEVPRGNPITVSWSSVGMSRTSPCSIFIEQGGVNSLLVQGNEGTKLVPTSATTTPGTWNFTLQCTLGSGSTIRQSASVSIR